VEGAKEKPPEGGLCNRYLKTLGEAKRRSALSAIGHKANANETQDHHGPGGGFGDGLNLQEAADFAARKHGAVNIEIGVTGIQAS
jgi:hypothetical protein